VPLVADIAALAVDARRRVPDPPPIEQVLEDSGRQRLATYYLYSALLAGFMGDDDLAQPRWPPELAEPMGKLGLSRLAPRTRPGIDAQLTQTEQATLDSPHRPLEFARLLVDLINHGAFGPLCGRADRVRLAAAPDESSDLNLELLRADQVVRICAVKDHWELVAQYLACTPVGDSAADAGAPGEDSRTTNWLKTSGVGHAVSLGTTLAVHIHPLGAAAGLGTKLVETRIRAGKHQAGALEQLGQELNVLRISADAEVADLDAHRRGS
jgi:hypothetical protein